MRTVRAIVLDRMKALDLGPYDVAKLLRGKMTPQTVYNFLKGRKDMNTTRLGFLLDKLDLRIVGGDEVAMEYERGRAESGTPNRPAKVRTAGSRRKPAGRK